MFYPGDPVEERKRQLIARLSGRGRGGGAGGMKVGRAPGFFGRGVMQGFGGAGNAFGRAIAPGLQGAPQGQSMFGGPYTPPPAAAPQFNMGSDIMEMGPSSPAITPSGLQNLIQPPPFIPIPQIQQLLAGYGGFGRSAPPPGTYF